MNLVLASHAASEQDSLHRPVKCPCMTNSQAVVRIWVNIAWPDAKAGWGQLADAEQQCQEFDGAGPHRDSMVTKWD